MSNACCEGCGRSRFYCVCAGNTDVMVWTFRSEANFNSKVGEVTSLTMRVSPVIFISKVHDSEIWKSKLKKEKQFDISWLGKVIKAKDLAKALEDLAKKIRGEFK